MQEQLHAAKASGVLLDWNTGKVLAVEGRPHASTPGSAIKPFLLTYALKHGIVDANTRVYCRRTLHVAGRSLPCSHPNDQPLLDAEDALAASCNTWFASLAQRMTAQDLQAALQQTGLPYSTTHFDEPDDRILTVLGLENVSTTPIQMAIAYRALFLHEAHTSVVWNGLRDSVAYGMANHARIKGAGVLGKTGTASNPGEWWTHGWFAGGIPNRFVLVIYVPRGDGGIAATLASHVFQHLLPEDAP
ncbi:penicillin-binding transpeptidase domain-containing protein [Silvibacterium dinghuense]|uniref:penicillin-binding transpeptidase domain-containing protein n=1 Tax=Silvibacterium dinghuense TaxID=1560006 RepID=UPI0013E9667C|nr:penicillin-binding transpeptidase domain-containing protein [Silvibacterium dinghuense]